MATSRLLTSHRRDLVHYLVEDDPAKAEKLFELMVITDPSTASGAAAREDALDTIYALTAHSQQGKRQHIREIVASFGALVACMLYVVCEHLHEMLVHLPLLGG